ncbi:cytochrome c-type biogenesis protein CycH [Marinobacterium nitratireducens]|uniref:Cytochrome c-type biogenesis protein CycH n=1 Tax=Marinobacterium nitratireducens TaxID=518897 RepID=A0A918DVG9_9GAMM|nr:c-type cytochrome biogenesis protein CcmI [Marinobacterium nitratireducens]GGO85091.1 cytochrome c-type biogenesis protein CycH [Marinobacterium nitratireducens]
MAGLWTGIAVLTVLAVAFVILPLLRARRLEQDRLAEDRDHQNIHIFRERLAELEQEQALGNLGAADFAELKLELERNLLQDVGTPAKTASRSGVGRGHWVGALLMAVLLPLSALAIYWQLGSAPKLQLALERQANPDPFDGRTPTLEEAVAQLEHELELNPENPEGWYLLGTTYMGQQRYDDSVSAFTRVLELLPQEAPQYAGVLGQYAQALYFANDGKMDDRIRHQVEQALVLNPDEVTSLGLLGIDAFENQRFAEAVDYWGRALQGADAGAQNSLRAGIERARQELEARGEAVPEVPGLEPAEIRLSVRLGDGIGQDLAPDQTVFVFARPVGGRMPLAALKLQVSDLPRQVVLDDSLAMTPQARLSTVDEVEVSARISMSGDPAAQSGDLYGTLSPVAVKGGSEVLELVIDQVVE